MSVATSTLVLLGVLVAVVVATLVVENWGRLRQPIGSPEPAPTASPDSAPILAASGPAPAAPSDRRTAVEVSSDAGAAPDVVEVPISERTVAVLFASYATARLPEDRRAAAWVTASERPPGRAGEAFRPGAMLRGRPGAVRQLLDCEDEGRCWVRLNHDVDIELGVARRPPRCEVLAALVQLWAAWRSSPVELEPDRVAALRRAVGRLGPTWSTTTGARHVAPLARALRHWTRDDPVRIVLVAVDGVGGPAGQDDAGIADSA